MSSIRAKLQQGWTWAGHALQARELVFVISGMFSLSGLAVALWQKWETLDPLPKILISTGFAGFSALVASSVYGLGVRLFRPAPLDVHVNDFTVFLRGEDESRGYFLLQDSMPFRAAITVLGLEITNKTAEDMSIDCSARLSLKTKSMLGEMFVDVKEHALHSKYESVYHQGFVTVPPHKTEHISKVFGLTDIQARVIGGVANLGNDHLLVLTDRVTQLTCTVHFKLA